MADNSTRIIISAEDRTRQAFESAKQGLQGIEAAAARLPLIGASLAGLFSASMFVDGIKGAISFAASLDDMAEKTGASVETLSALTRVAKIGGHDVDLMERGIIKLANSLADADDKSSKAAQALKALGLDAAKLRSMDTGVAFKMLADRVSEFGDSQGKTAAISDLLGDKLGASLLPVMKDLAEEGALVGKVTTEQAAAAEKFEKNINRLKVEMGGLARTIAAEVVPALNKFFELANAPGAGLHGALLANIDQALGNGDPMRRLEELRTRLSKIESGSILEPQMLIPGMREAEIGKLKSAVAAYERIVELRKKAEFDQGFVGPRKEPGDLSGYVSKDAKEKAVKIKAEKKNPYEGLYGFEEGRSAREIMAQLHAEDRELESIAEAAAKAEQALIDMTDVGRVAKLNEKLDIAAKLLSEDKISFEGYDQIVEQLAGLKDKGKDTFDELARAIDGWGKQAADAMVNFALLGKGSFSDMTKSILADIAKMLVYKKITGPIATNIADLITKSADGGVYSGSGISAYSGQIVSSPTLFKFASGIGLMGEAGAEAILPLKRGSDGKLGVQAANAGLEVTIHNYGTERVRAESVPDGRGGRRLEVTIGEMVAAQMRTPGSPANLAMRSPTMVRR